MTTKARRKKQTAKQPKSGTQDNIISLTDHDYSDFRGVKIHPKFPYKFTKNQKYFIDFYKNLIE